MVGYICFIWLLWKATQPPAAQLNYIKIKGEQMRRATERIRNEVPDYKPDRPWNRKHNRNVRFRREMIMAEEGLTVG